MTLLLKSPEISIKLNYTFLHWIAKATYFKSHHPGFC